MKPILVKTANNRAGAQKVVPLVAKALALALVLLALNTANGGTIVSGVVDGDTWTPAGSPYLVTGDIWVAQLTIQAGVEIQFQGAYEFQVAGLLQAQGTPASPIWFHPAAGTAWQGIFFNESGGGSALISCVVEGSTNSGVRILNSTPALIGCVLANNSTTTQGGGLHAKLSAGRLLASDCVVTNNVTSLDGGGLYLEGEAELSHCLIADNQALAGNGAGGGLLIIGNSMTGSTTLRNCEITRNRAFSHIGGGLVAQYFYSSQYYWPVRLFNCKVTTNSVSSPYGAALYAEGKVTCEIVNCTFVANNIEAIEMYWEWTSVWCAQGVVTNSILFYNNNGGQQMVGNVTAYYSDIQGGGTENGNKAVNPVFNPVTLALLSSSTCIDAGDPNPTFNDVCFPPSKGEARNDMGVYGGPGAAGWLAGNSPEILIQPKSQASCLGLGASFWVAAVGSEPLNYQWYFTGNPLAGQTATNLVFPWLDSSHAGTYSVVVANVFGAVTSAPVHLVVYDRLADVDLRMYAGLTISGQTGLKLGLSYTTDLGNSNSWVPLATNVMGSAPWFYLDLESPFSKERFYKVDLLP